MSAFLFRSQLLLRVLSVLTLTILHVDVIVVIVVVVIALLSIKFSPLISFTSWTFLDSENNARANYPVIKIWNTIDDNLCDERHEDTKRLCFPLTECEIDTKTYYYAFIIELTLYHFFYHQIRNERLGFV